MGFSVDLDGRIVTYTVGPEGPTRLLRTLHYDAAGRIKAMKHTGTGTVAPLPAYFDQTFEYGDLNRLTKFINSTQTQIYSYDSNGNRTGIGISGQQYAVNVSATSNRLTSAAGPLPAKTYSFDAAGNMTGDGSRTPRDPEAKPGSAGLPASAGPEPPELIERSSWAMPTARWATARRPRRGRKARKCAAVCNPSACCASSATL